MKRIKGLVALFLGAETAEEMKGRGLKLSALFAGAEALDYGLMFVTAGLVSLLKWLSVPEWGIFLALWIGNMAVSGFVVWYCDRVGEGATYVDGARRVIDFVLKKSIVLGVLLELALFLRFLLWNGADQFLMFFRPRLSSWAMKAIVFTLASFTQMAVWTIVYARGYDSIVDLLK